MCLRGAGGIKLYFLITASWASFKPYISVLMTVILLTNTNFVKDISFPFQEILRNPMKQYMDCILKDIFDGIFYV